MERADQSLAHGETMYERTETVPWSLFPREKANFQYICKIFHQTLWPVVVPSLKEIPPMVILQCQEQILDVYIPGGLHHTISTNASKVPLQMTCNETSSSYRPMLMNAFLATRPEKELGIMKTERSSGSTPH